MKNTILILAVISLAGISYANPAGIDNNGAVGPTDLAYEVQLNDLIELLDMLADDVIEFVQHNGVANSLLAKIDTAIAKLEDNNDKNDEAAVNSLQAFINAVEAQTGKKISEEQADYLIVFAQQIIDLLVNQWLGPAQFAYIPPGTFEMGDHHDSMGEALPVHTVTLDSFYMGKYEITNQQYCDYLNSAYSAVPARIKVDGGVVYAADDTSNSFPYCDTSSYNAASQINFSGPDPDFSVNIKGGTTDMSNHPMVRVSWYGCVAYCNWKSQQKGLENCYDISTWDCDFTKNGFRLPTEAQWEYAARGGNHSPYYRYPWGDSIDGGMANYWESGDPYETEAYPWTTPIGYYDGGQIPAGTDMANGYGLYDVAGNVFEWCNDWYGSYSSGPQTNPTGPASGSDRILRGGACGGYDYYCWVANRDLSILPDRRHNGFRVCVFASH